MMFKRLVFCSAMVLAAAGSSLAQAPPEMKAKLDAQIKQLQAIAADPQVVSAVKQHNSTPASAEAAAMTNEKWGGLSLFDPFVKAVAKAPVSAFLKSKTDDVISEVFVSGADGRKVGFAAKTTYYIHKGMPKHDVPMSGKVFIGPLKQDESSGVMEIQVGVPVMDGGKPIGSIIFGLRADKLR